MPRRLKGLRRKSFSIIGNDSRGRDELIKKTRTRVEADDHQVGRIVSQAGSRLAERNLTKDGREEEGHVRYVSVLMGKIEQRSDCGDRKNGREEP